MQKIASEKAHDFIEDESKVFIKLHTLSNQDTNESISEVVLTYNSLHYESQQFPWR